MQSLVQTVGRTGVNFRWDVALVQALLTHAQRPLSRDPNRRHYMHAIHGSTDAATVAAIRLFQSDQAALASGPAAKEQPSGTISPDDETWAALVAAVPVQFRDLRVLSGSVTVYIADSPARLAAVIQDAGTWGLHPSFLGKVTDLMKVIHRDYGIAISVCKEGGLRTFDEQLRQLKKKTSKAGPGEGLHCYGLAVDLGFNGLQWLRGNGTVVAKEDWWMHQLKAQKPNEPTRFWDLLRDVGEANDLYRGPEFDRPHLQAYDDSIIMAERFAALLTSRPAHSIAGSRDAKRMVWEGRNSAHGRLYKCDLGFGRDLFEVGTSVQIWGSAAPITTAMLNEANGHKPGAPGGATRANVQDMQKALREEFEWAETNYMNFTP